MTLQNYNTACQPVPEIRNMAPSAGARPWGNFRLRFDLRVRLWLHRSRISSNRSLPLFRKFHESFGLGALDDHVPQNTRTGKNGRHNFVGLVRQFTFAGPAGYPDVNGAYRLCGDPVM